MASLRITTILLLLLLISFSTVAYVSGDNDDTKTVYQVLQGYDFPVGIIPKGATGYKLDNSTGKFSLYLNGSCSFSIDSYKLKYMSTITGVIKKDKLSSLSGIKVKVLILWLSISEVIRDDDELDFSVGIASADFPVNNFEESPTCGCGFDCVNANEKKLINRNGFVSSS
ncbi:hypothetical protein LWI29_029270 [Acer saccharum]|uniref:Uncharacterized protein n=1 Tax=Acer saccharum TaxID=4024 RepID=A0AA39VK98_ACESA|nr:hypothetical protein LWI29_029270 [Acer saccharum]